MNKPMFEEVNEILISIIDETQFSNIDSDNKKEKSYRLERLNHIFNNMLKNGLINEQFHQIAHELKSIPFLLKFGSLNIALDSRNQIGCDFLLNNECYIECII